MRRKNVLCSTVIGTLLMTMLMTDLFAQDFKPIPIRPIPAITYPFKNYQDGFCMQFEVTSMNSLGGFIRELEESTPYSIDDYLQHPGCSQAGYAHTVKSPMLHLIADNVHKHDEALQKFHKYYNVKRKDNSLWLAAVNAKNTEGETVLDYFELRRRQHNYPSEISRKVVASIVAFACSKGAVYSKYPLSCSRE